MNAKTTLSRQITADALKDAQDDIRTAIHVREAVKLGLAVVEMEGRHPDEIGEESTADVLHRGSFKTIVVSGDELKMIDWVQALANLGVAFESYQFELPPSAKERDDEDMWGEFFTDRIDSPAVNVGCQICDDEQWEWGLPAPTPPAPRVVNVNQGNLMDVEVTLLNLKADAVAYRRVQEALEVAGFGPDTIDAALATVQAITATGNVEQLAVLN